VLSGLALGAKHLYLTTRTGQIIVLDSAGGTRIELFSIGHPILVPLLLAEGRAIITTTSGILVVLELGEDADGWTARCGGLPHNGVRR